ncbi:hypothetical protein FACS1894200_03070 [Spirochaetia bacterium]|nr:hypothetical protein FACS1894200_03070 [Spirochaetia bacterium]
MKSVSLIINTYNRRPFLTNTLTSLKYLRYPELEIICVNGPSTDGTDELLRDWAGQIKLLDCSETNLSMSRNIGIRAATGDIVCFIDDDAIPEPNWLNNLTAVFDRPKVAAAGGFIRDRTGVTYQSRYVCCDRFGEGYHFEQYKDVNINGLKPTEWGTKYYTALTGTNVCFKRDILVQLGGFDEAYVYFLDETDVLIRMIDAGYEIVCVEAAEVHHKSAVSFLQDEKRIPRCLYYPMRSRSYFAWRHTPEYCSMAEIHANLRYQTMMVQEDINGHLANKDIYPDRHRTLQDEIEQGMKDGLKLAFSLGAPFLKPSSFFENPPDFKSFFPFLTVEKRLRLCFISQDYPPNPNGGIGVWVSELARGLAGRGHEISVVTRAKKDYNTVDFEEGVWVHRIIQETFPNRIYAAPNDLPQISYDWAASAYKELKRIMLIRGIDLVFAPVWDVEGIITHCEGKIPVVLTLHTSYALAMPSKPEWRKRSDYMQKHIEPIIRAEKMLWEQAPLVIANSKAIVRDLTVCYGKSMDECRLAIIPHGLEDRYTHSQKHVAPNESEKCRILFVGRFEERKGIDILLACIPAIAEQYPLAIFELIGSNTITEFWKNFRNQYKDKPWFKRISALGYVSPAELSAAYSACDIFVAPSRYESFGIVYLEAMMHGKPCIGSSAGGIPEVVRDGENGLTPPPGDVDALKNALTTLIEQKELRRMMGEKAREIYLQHYTGNAMIDCFEKAIKKFHFQGETHVQSY